MKLFKCDHCGKTEIPHGESDYIPDWERVTISTHFHYDICEECSSALFRFFEKPVSPEPALSDSDSGAEPTSQTKENSQT